MQNVLSKLPVKQRGASFFSWLFILFVAVFLFQVGSKLVPIYVESYTVQQSLKTLMENNTLSDLASPEVRTKLSKSFSINNVRGAAAQSINVKKADGAIIIDIEYEERVSFIGNVDLVVSFHHHLNSSKPHECCQL